MTLYLDGDFPSKQGNCQHHCSPSCHPAQIGPDWVYGCTHKAWPQNRERDFVPIVDCDGEVEKCDIPLSTIGRSIGGKKRSIQSRMRKLAQLNSELEELESIQKLKLKLKETL